MYLEGPGTVGAGKSITVKAVGVAKAESVKFEVSGANGGFDVVSPGGSDSCHFRTEMTFEGDTTIKAIAQDKFLGVIATASLSVKVVDTSNRGGGKRMQVSGPTTVEAGLRGAFMASDIGDAHSVLIEMSGANVGYDRIYPEGRTAVTYGARMDSVGETTITAHAQDEDSNTLASASFTFNVVSLARVRDDGPGVGGGYIVKAPREVEVMAPWSYTISGLKNVHSVLVELYGANGGMFRIFPRGRDTMQHAFVPAGLGKTTVMMMFRDAQLNTLHTLAGEINVVPHPVGGPGAGGGYEPVSRFGPLPAMGPNKPPVAFSARSGLSPYASAGAQSGSMAPLSSSSRPTPSTAEELAKQKEAELLAKLSRKKP